MLNTTNQYKHFPSFVILGIVESGQVFRPSDWADRLCGVMSSFQPLGVVASRLTYSPYVMPGQKDGNKCVHVDGAIASVEPMAYQFLRNFARDNQLQIVEI